MELFPFWSKRLTTLHITLLFQIFGKCVSDKIWNKCPLQTEALRLLPLIPMKDCLNECQIRNDCQLICYRTTTKLCEIYGSSAESSSCKGCVSVLRKENQFVQPCSCEEGQTCNKLTGFCEYTECGKLFVPSGKTVNGNLANVGAKKITQCCGSTDRSEESTCTDNGKWENVPSCDDICSSSEKIFSLTDALQIRFYIRAVSQEDAKCCCNAMGGALVKLDEEDKMIAIRNIIFDDPDLRINDYWVDGYSEIAYDPDAWKFSDGTQMPMEEDVFWESKPNEGNIPSCTRLRRVGSYLLNDKACTYPFSYICEMQ